MSFLFVFFFSLQKKYTARPNYEELLVHPFLKTHRDQETDVAAFVDEILNLPDEGQ